MLNLHVVVASTRPSRVGPVFAAWMMEEARRHGRYDPELVDLAEVNLPLLDEPAHPRLRRYEHAHTKAWSATVERADAFVFVQPEYNYGPPPALVNALDYLVHEWAYKPVGFLSYGGISGGTRGVQAIKPLVTTLKMMPMVEAVVVPMFQQHLDEAGAFVANEMHAQAARVMLDELARWAEALKPLRAPVGG